MRLADKEQCTGCGVCAAVCQKGSITMERDAEGFLAPKIDEEKCVNCGSCTRICPIINTESGLESRNEWKEMYAAYTSDSEIRKRSTSGGIATVLARRIIETGGAVVGASFYDGVNLKHIVVENKEDLVKLQKSKYFQSDMTGIYDKVKTLVSSGKRVLFVGCPCQVDGLKRYVGDDSGKLVTCGLLCHGVPSPGLFKDYTAYLEKKNKSKICAYDFRSRKYQKAANVAVKVDYKNGKSTHTLQHFDPFHYWFGLHYSIRNSCFRCKYRMSKRVSDITTGDFWHIEKYLPDLNVGDGVSRLFINTENGKSLIDECRQSFVMHPLDIEETLKVTKMILENPKVPTGRKQFFADYASMPMKALIKKYKPPMDLNGLKVLIKFSLKR